MKLKLSWQEGHYHMRTVQVASDGTPLNLGDAITNALAETCLVQRSGIIPESIKFEIVEN